ncbi:MAG: cbb3-type cytochrome oxidase assembly protein CcoS [Pseudomonadota bacterium]
MNLIYMLIPIAIILLIAAIGGFFWAVGNGQYDDLDSPSLIALEEDEDESE